MKNIVIIGGGTGTFTLLKGLRKYPSNNSVIVSSSDDGGSTGRLRESLGVFPPGDLRQCLVGLSYTDEPMKELFNFRFNKGELAGHTAGNIIIAALEKITGKTEKAVELAAKMLNVRGQVIPVTNKPTLLSATYENGKKVAGEHNIDEPKENFKSKIKSLKLTPNGPANPGAIKAINEADAIILGPGDLYTSILPNILVKGAAAAINKSKAQKIFVAPIMSKPGQTDNLAVSQYVMEIEKYLSGKIHTVIANTGKPAPGLASRYKKTRAAAVKIDSLETQKRGVKLVTEDLLSRQVFQKAEGDNLARSVIRHDIEKTAKVIWELLN